MERSPKIHKRCEPARTGTLRPSGDPTQTNKQNAPTRDANSKEEKTIPDNHRRSGAGADQKNSITPIRTRRPTSGKHGKRTNRAPGNIPTCTGTRHYNRDNIGARKYHICRLQKKRGEIARYRDAYMPTRNRRYKTCYVSKPQDKDPETLQERTNENQPGQKRKTTRSKIFANRRNRQDHSATRPGPARKTKKGKSPINAWRRTRGKGTMTPKTPIHANTKNQTRSNISQSGTEAILSIHKLPKTVSIRMESKNIRPDSKIPRKAALLSRWGIRLVKREKRN